MEKNVFEDLEFYFNKLDFWFLGNLHNFFPDDCLRAEIARQAAQMKLMRKLEKQALARAAKEARKQQGKLKF